MIRNRSLKLNFRRRLRRRIRISDQYFLGRLDLHGQISTTNAGNWSKETQHFCRWHH